MRTLSRFALAALALCTPIVVAAAAPASVTGIKASLQDGKVFVSWTPVTDPNITAYRVFYSHASILRSNGLYDDYDTTDGSVNSYVIPNTPQAQTLYVSVMAENAQGEESPYFAEETSVKLSGGDTTPEPIVTSSAASSISAFPTSMMASSPVSSKAVQPADTSVRLLSVRTLSATGVELTFSQTVAIDPAIDLRAFDIESGSGEQLPLTRFVVAGNVVQLHTFPQDRGSVYVIILKDGIRGINANGTTVPLDANQVPVLFTGDPSGILGTTSSAAAVSSQGSSSSKSSSSLPPSPVLSDVSSVILRSVAEKNGYYTITATWQVANDNAITGFQVSQTTDKGRTYSQSRTLPVSVLSATVPHVPAGNFGLLVRAVYADGTISKGILKMVQLAGTTTSTLPGNVISKPTTSHLPQSGPGLWTVVLMTGSALGYATMKRMTIAKA